MPFARFEGLFHTLRFRLTFWSTALLLLIAAATLLGLRQALAYTLRTDLDRLLNEDADEIALILQDEYQNRQTVQEELERKAEAHSEEGWFAQIYTDRGAIYVSSGLNSPSGIPLTFVAPRKGFTSDGYRMVQRKVNHPAIPPLVIRVGATLKNVDEDVSRVTTVMLLIGGVVLPLAPAFGYWLAGRGTRPLAQILRTTEGLRPDHLDERLPLRHTDDELDRLSATINSFLDRLASHLRQQRDFVANAAHELRSPLAALRSSIEVALSCTRCEEEYQDLLAELADQCSSMSTLVNRLLLIAEGDAGQLQPGDTEEYLDQLVSRAASMFEGAAEQRGIQLTASFLEPTVVRGDKIHLHQVIHNLLDNALKFTPPGGKVELKVSPDPETNEGPAMALFEVKDTGVGIPATEVPHVLERFYRADRARQRGGQGLGLSICQTIVKAYGGRIDIESQPGVGTCVTVRLPRIDTRA